MCLRLSVLQVDVSDFFIYLKCLYFFLRLMGNYIATSSSLTLTYVRYIFLNSVLGVC